VRLKECNVEFMPVCEVLAIIAEKINLEPDFIYSSSFEDEIFQTAFVSFLNKNRAHLDWQHKLSFAAQILLRAIYNTKTDLISHWLNFDNENDPENKSKIIDILKIQKSVGSNFSKLCGDAVRNATSGYKSELISDLELRPENQPDFLVNSSKLGFDRLQIFQLLRENNIEYASERIVELKLPNGKVITEHITYEDLPNDNDTKTNYPKLIIKTIKELGHDRLNLIVSDDGATKGTKGLVWDKVEKEFNKENKKHGSFLYYWKIMKRSGELRDKH